MKTCNKEAGEKKLKGDDRKNFMSTCLSTNIQAAGVARAAPTATLGAPATSAEGD